MPWFVPVVGRYGERISAHSEPEGRGAAWTEERATEERATREGGASRAPRRRAQEIQRAVGAKAPRRRAPEGQARGCPLGPQAGEDVRWPGLPLSRRIACSTSVTRTSRQDMNWRASHRMTGTSGSRLSAALTASAGKRLAPSKQLTATMNGVPCRSK